MKALNLHKRPGAPKGVYRTFDGVNKLCPTCKIWNPLENFHKCKKGSGGVGVYCKNCLSKAHKSFVQSNGPRIHKPNLQRIHPEEKTCTNCKEEKSIDEFYFKKKENYYLAECKNCLRIKAKGYRAAKPEAKKNQNAEYRKKHPEQMRVRDAASRERRKIKFNWMKAKLAELGVNV